MAGAMFAAHEGARGGSGWRLFPDWVSRPSLEGSWGAFFAILGDFGSPVGTLGAPFLYQNVTFFRV